MTTPRKPVAWQSRHRVLPTSPWSEWSNLEKEVYDYAREHDPGVFEWQFRELYDAPAPVAAIAKEMRECAKIAAVAGDKANAAAFNGFADQLCALEAMQ